MTICATFNHKRGIECPHKATAIVTLIGDYPTHIPMCVAHTLNAHNANVREGKILYDIQPIGK